MFLLNWVKIDFGQIFNQGFRLLLLGTTIVCYGLLFAFHCFMLRPMFKVCGKAYFSVITRWMFRENIPKPVAASYTEVAVVCYITNVQDMTVMSFGLLFIALFTCECCLRQRKKNKLLKLLKRQQSANFVKDKEGESSRISVGGRGSIVGREDVKPDAKILRQRLSRKYSTTRFIGRLAMLIPSSFLASIHFICSNITFLLIYLVVPALDAETRTATIIYFEAIKWRTLIYLILSFFMCGFYWSMSGIDMSMLKAIYARSRRQDLFRRMNASVFTEGNTIV